uniref:Cathepsin n=1 Tax=Latrunculia oparinae TaxID=553186 RepID=B5LT55_LATOP|nr:cathepsin [Latrunculia oparinae]
MKPPRIRTTLHSRRIASKILYSKVSRSCAALLAWAACLVAEQHTVVPELSGELKGTCVRFNTAYIPSHNSYADKFGFTLAMNKYGDMTSEEYSQSMRCVEKFLLPSSPSRPTQPPVSGIRTCHSLMAPNTPETVCPEEVDWRTKGAVSAVKDQGRCKSCYAFATTAALEGMHALATGRLVPLSEQNVIDCSVPYGNRGCSGGSRMATIMYAVDNGGIDGTSSYPYLGRQYLCKFTEESIATGCTGMVRIKRGKEQDLKKAVAVVGPVTVAVDSRHTSFQFYASGIYSEPSCSRTKLTHTLIIIGYGSKSGHDYWLLKNSWGTSWGEDGYIMMSRNYANQCGIATKAMYTTI